MILVSSKRGTYTQKYAGPEDTDIVMQTVVQHFETGYADDKGRTIGAVVTTWTEPEGGWGNPDGVTPASFQPCMTRGGKPFGASQPSRHFKTPGLRDAAILDYLTGLMTRTRRRKDAHVDPGFVQTPDWVARVGKAD